MKFKKLSTNIVYTPTPYLIYIPGYSVLTNIDNEATLTSSAIPYIVTYLTARGYNATAVNVKPSLPFKIGSVWYCSVFPLPKRDSLSGLYIWSNPGSIPLRNQDVSDYTSYNYINYPAEYKLFAPNPVAKRVPIKGWNGGGTSIDKFTGKGYVEFSVSRLAVAVFIGVSKKSLAILDSHYVNIEYSIYAHLGTYSCYASGVKQSSNSTYLSSDVFKIELTSTQVNYYKNDVLFFSLDRQMDFEEYVLDTSMYYSEDSVTNYSITQDPNLIEFVFEIPIQGKILTQQDLFFEFPIPIGVDFTLDNSIPLDFVFNITLVSNIFPKDYIGLDCTIPLEASIEIGTEVPYIPFNLVVEIPITGYIRDNYIYPVQMFVIT